MFTRVTLKNFRTHVNSSIDLHPVTLLIGNNGSGKTNFLEGIQYFSDLSRRGNREDGSPQISASQDLCPYRYRWAGEQEPIEFTFQWKNENKHIFYTIEIYPNQRLPGKAGCREKLIIASDRKGDREEITNGYHEPTDSINLRKIIRHSSILTVNKKVCEKFFDDLDRVFNCCFEPSALTGLTNSALPRSKNDIFWELEGREYNNPYSLVNKGDGFQDILRNLKEKDPKSFSLFLEKMQTIDPTFKDVQYDRERQKNIWKFYLPSQRSIEDFETDMVSYGFLLIAAISLITSLQKPPSLIMIEDIASRINPGNIRQIMYWIWQATSPSRKERSQFILTSHSLSVLREFNDYPDHVYTLQLDKKIRASEITNLNTDLDTLVKIGTLDTEQVEFEEEGETHKKLIKVPKRRLDELWYSGAIG